MIQIRQRRPVIVMVAALLSAAGILTALRLPFSIFPPVVFPLIKVIADVGEEPAARMMPEVTRPLEQAILGVPGIRVVRSTTSRGSTEISAGFDWGTDMQAAFTGVQARTDQARPALPQDLRLTTMLMNTAVFPILGYALTSDRASESELLELAEFTLKPALARIPGVAQIQVQGGRRREFQVRLSPEAMAARRLAVADVVAAIRRNNQVLSSGLTEANHELYLSLVDGVVHDREGLGRIPIPVAGGGIPVLLGEIATIVFADAASYVRTTADGHPAVLVNLVAQPSANCVTIAEDTRALFAQNPGLLPSGVRWTTFYDQPSFVVESVLGVRDAILIGVALSALVLLIFLRSLRLTAVAITAIPVTIAITLLAFGPLGQTINLMTLGGIAAALGLIADDAIVVVESIQRHREEGVPRPVRTGLAAIRPALVASSLSTIVIFLPFALLTGLVGAFFQPLALTMGLALTVSLFASMLLVPALATKRAEEPRPAAAAAAAPPPWTIRHGWVGALACVALLAGGAAVYARMGSDLLPTMDEGSIVLDYWTPPGTSLTDTDAMLRSLETEILRIPDVRSYSRRTGTQLGFFITEPNRGDYVIRLKPRRERRGVEEVIATIRDRAAAVAPAVHTDFGQLLEDDIGDLTGGVPQPIDLKIYGENQQILQARAREAAKILRGVRGVQDVFDGIVIAGPALTIQVLAAAPERTDSPLSGPRGTARLGLTTEDVHAAVEPAIAGTVAGDVRIGERLYDVRVFARDPAGVSSLRIRTPSGALVPLTDVASVSTGAPEAEIDRENLQTYLGVTARLEGRDLGSGIAEIRTRLARDLHLPGGMSLGWGGQYEQQQLSFQQLLLVLLGGLVLVAVVGLFHFVDWRAPVLTGLIAAASLSGVFAALWLTGMTVNVSSFVGAIMVVGIVGENCVFVIHEAREALRRDLPVREAWAFAARRRRRPVAMTILASALALAPLALALGDGSQLIQPLAIAVIGGFVLSGPLVLIVLPALYAWIDPHARLAHPGSDEPRHHPLRV